MKALVLSSGGVDSTTLPGLVMKAALPHAIHVAHAVIENRLSLIMVW